MVSCEKSMEDARDLALEMQRQGHGKVLDQFNNQTTHMPIFPPPARKFGTRPQVV